MRVANANPGLQAASNADLPNICMPRFHVLKPGVCKVEGCLGRLKFASPVLRRLRRGSTVIAIPRNVCFLSPCFGSSSCLGGILLPFAMPVPLSSAESWEAFCPSAKELAANVPSHGREKRG